MGSVTLDVETQPEFHTVEVPAEFKTVKLYDIGSVSVADTLSIGFTDAAVDPLAGVPAPITGLTLYVIEIDTVNRL